MADTGSHYLTKKDRVTAKNLVLCSYVLLALASISAVIMCLFVDVAKGYVLLNESMNASLPVTDRVHVVSIKLFWAEYDASGLTDAQLAATGLPRALPTSQVEDFPLLFPRRSNYVLHILPINREALSKLGLIGEVVLSAVEDDLVELEALDAFDMQDYDYTYQACDAYIDDTQIALLNLSNSAQTLVPLIPRMIFSYANLETILIPDFQAASANMTIPASPLAQIFLDALPLVIEAVDNFPGCAQFGADVDRTSILDANGYICLTQLYTEEFGPILRPVFDQWPDLCADLGVGQCFELTGGAILPEAFPGDSGVDLFVNLDICGVTGSCENKQQYVEFLFSIVTSMSNPHPELVHMVTVLRAVYYEFKEDRLNDTEISESMLEVINGEPLPSSFLDSYISCKVLSALIRVENPSNPSISDNTADPAACGLLGFLSVAETAAERVDEPVAQLLQVVATLYQGCVQAPQNGGIVLQPAQCSQTWGPFFINRAYLSPLNPEIVVANSTFEPDFVNRVLGDICEDDADDLSRFGVVQFLATFGTPIIGIGLLCVSLPLVFKSLEEMWQLAICALVGVAQFFVIFLNVKMLLFLDGSEPNGENFVGNIVYEEGIISFMLIFAVVLTTMSCIGYYYATFLRDGRVCKGDA